AALAHCPRLAIELQAGARKARTRVADPERLQSLEVLHRGLGQRRKLDLAVQSERGLEILTGEPLIRAGDEGPGEVRYALCGDAQPGGHGVSAEDQQVLRAGLKSPIQFKVPDAS